MKIMLTKTAKAAHPQRFEARRPSHREGPQHWSWACRKTQSDRDLRELAQEGLLQRVHGGALPASTAVVDFAGRQRKLHICEEERSAVRPQR